MVSAPDLHGSGFLPIRMRTLKDPDPDPSVFSVLRSKIIYFRLQLGSNFFIILALAPALPPALKKWEIFVQ